MGNRQVGRDVVQRLLRGTGPVPHAGARRRRDQTHNHWGLALSSRAIAGAPGGVESMADFLAEERRAWCGPEALAYVPTNALGPGSIAYAVDTGQAAERCHELIPAIQGWMRDLALVVDAMTVGGVYRPVGCRTKVGSGTHHDSVHVVAIARLLRDQNLQLGGRWSVRFERLVDAQRRAVEIDDAAVWMVAHSPSLRGCAAGVTGPLPPLQEELRVWRRGAHDLTASYARPLRCERDRNRHGEPTTSRSVRVRGRTVERHATEVWVGEGQPGVVFPGRLNRDRPITPGPDPVDSGPPPPQPSPDPPPDPLPRPPDDDDFRSWWRTEGRAASRGLGKRGAARAAWHAARQRGWSPCASETF